MTITFQYNLPSRKCTKPISVRAFLSLQNIKPYPGPQVLVYCLYDAFIASILCTTKIGFQFWEQMEVRRSHIKRIWGMRKYFKSTFSCNSHGNLWQVARGVVLQEQNIASFPRLFLAISWRSHLNSHAQYDYAPFIVRPCSSLINNHDHPLTIPKDWGHHLPCWMNPLKFLRNGVSQGASMLALHFWFRFKVVNQCLLRVSS